MLSVGREPATWPCGRCEGEGYTFAVYGQLDTYEDCDLCQGFGQFTRCPLCAGKGCWDCDNGRVAGP